MADSFLQLAISCQIVYSCLSERYLELVSLAEVGWGGSTIESHLNAITHHGRIFRQLKIVVMGLGLWSALVLLFTTQFVLVGSFSWREALRQALFFWGLWVFLVPATALLSFEFPFERSRIWQGLGIHILTGVLIVTVSQIAFRHFIPSPFPPPGEALRNLLKRRKCLETMTAAYRAVGGENYTIILPEGSTDEFRIA